MHPRSQVLPTQAELMFPLLDLAVEAGGRISSKDAYAELAKRHSLPPGVSTEKVLLECGQRHNLWERHVRYAKERDKHAGYMTVAEPGLWQVTDEGREAMKHAKSAVCVTLVIGPENKPIGAQAQLCVGVPTVHTMHCGDARDMSWIGDETIPLIVTSVPYHDLKQYESVPGQLGDIGSYDEFVDEMTDAMRECYRVLIPGARMALNVGNILRSRSRHGTHEVLPLSADLTVNCRRIGFNALTGIVWRKMQNCRYEEGAGGVLGQPGMPRMCIKSESEDILLFKKPGPNFHASPEQREASRISKADWAKWVRPFWDDVPGARATATHPAPFPVEIPFRLISMFSYTGPVPHTVLDPFGGEFNTAKAAMRARRSSVCNDISPTYVQNGIGAVATEAERLQREWNERLAA